MFSGIGIVVAIILFASGWIAMFMLIGQLKRHYPSIYADLGSPTSWGYFMGARAGWFARDDNKSFKRFLFEREFERLDRPDVRALGWLSLGGPPIGILVGAISLMVGNV
jgi:hypothetical protein